MQKIKLAFFAFLSMMMLQSKAQSPCDTTVWYENNGIVVVEMEQQLNLNGWVRRDSLAGFTNSKIGHWATSNQN